MINLAPNHFDIVKNILSRIVPRTTVWAFGSRINKKAKPYSDLDLVIIGSTSLPPLTLSSLREAFEESDLPFQVDLLEWSAIAQDFRQLILKKHVTLQN